MIEGPRKDSAEEQLLRMIEGGSPAAPKASPPAPTPPGLRLQQWLAQVSSAGKARWRSIARRHDRRDPVLRNLQIVSQAAWVVLACLGLYVVFGVMLAKPKRGPTILIPTAAPSSSQGTAAMAPDEMGKPLAEYLSEMLRRNPFTGSAASAVSTAPIRNAREKLKELAGGLLVVGIDRGAKPEALIEDTQHQKTYFIKVGDVVNGMIIKEISARGVIVAYEGEELLLQ